MTARLNFDPARDRSVFAAMLNLSTTVRRSGLEHSLIHLIKTRVSQINGWNRFAIAFQFPAGDYQPGAAARG